MYNIHEENRGHFQSFYDAVYGNSTNINQYEGFSSHRKYYFPESIKDHLLAVNDTVYGDSTKVIQLRETLGHLQ
jgi:hypothetical protein